MTPHAELVLSSGALLSPRRFSVREAMSELFTITVLARTEDATLDLSTIVGQPAGFRLRPDVPGLAGAARAWTGLCRRAEQNGAETEGLATYTFHLVPALWLLTQRVNHRIFQHVSIPDIVDRILREWRVAADFRIDRPAYPALEYKVQYGETDFGFVSRLLEEAGIAYFFEDDGARSSLVLCDEPQTGRARPGSPVPFAQSPGATSGEFLTALGHARDVRPTAWMLRDHDLRRPTHPLTGAACRAGAPEGLLERFHYQPGAFVIDTRPDGSTPAADDRGAARHDDAYGRGLAERALDAERAGDHTVFFDTNVLDLRPGTVFRTTGHAHPVLADGTRLLISSSTIDGESTDICKLSGRAVLADRPYRPARRTPKPRIGGVHPAIVVGPRGQEIHTDELGRVRVQFPWDREGKGDELTSCWIRASQGWGGVHYGSLMLPRVGHEVLVEFFDGDPDRPVLVGRTYNAAAPVPYKLPDHKTISTWKSDCSPGSGGFNEIKYEDKKSDELFYLQAEKNLRALVKHDDTSTVLRHRQKMVHDNETDTTGANRIEVTGALRTEATGGQRTVFVGGDRRQRVFGDETERTERRRMLRVGEDVDWVVAGTKRELVGREEMPSPVHQEVRGDRRERVEKSQSLTIALDQFEKIGGRHALAAGRRIHLLAGESLAGEAPSITFKGAGGFVRIDGASVTIRGKLVKINVGGTPGKGRGAHPTDPEKAEEAAPFGAPLLQLTKTARARVQRVAHAVATGIPAPGLAHGITFDGTGKIADLYKMAKGTPERDALTTLLAQGRKVAQIRQILESATDFQKRPFKKGEKLFGFVPKGAPRKAASSPYWLDEATFERIKAAHFKEGSWRPLDIQQALGLPATNTADALVVAEVTADHEGLSSVVLPAKARLFGRDADGNRWQAVSLKGGVLQVTPGPRWLGLC